MISVSYKDIEVWSQNIEIAKQKRINEGIEDKFEPDVRLRYRVCYTVENKRYTRLFKSLELAEFIYNELLIKNKYKNVCLYEVNEVRRLINE